MFRINTSDYAAREKEGRASVTQWQITIIRLKKQLANDRERLKTLKHSAELARAEFGRVGYLIRPKDLFIGENKTPVQS